MSGKPRMNGARAALDYFQVPDADQRVEAYAERKQTMVIELIEAGEFTAYPDALRFIIAAKDAGIKVAAASSSKNAGLFLRQIRLDTFAREHAIASKFVSPGLSLLDFFDADVSGRDFARGKPHPEMFLTAAQELGVAAKAGNMAALGLARADDADLLTKANADLVVTSLDVVDLTALGDGRLARRAV
jgi:beta-phosphoglucomutase-like phosphatase (HAD superfamily)